MKLFKKEQKTDQYALNLPWFYDDRMTDYQIAKTYFQTG